MDLPVQRKLPFLFVGNQACLDFINTELVMNGQPMDLVTSFQDLVAWVVEAGLLTADKAKKIEQQDARGAETLRQAKVFRTNMREVVERLAAGRSVPQGALDAINDLLCRHRAGYPLVNRRGRIFERTHRVGVDGSNQLLGLLAEAASDLLCECDVSLIKKCHNPACVLFFYDTTKNHARHWCSMSLCGNRSKVAAHYRRHRKR